MDDVKAQFARHLTGNGFEQAPHDVIMQKLRQRMGEQRFKEVFNAASGHSARAHEEFYTRFADLVEANLMRSLDPGATLEASFQLYGRMKEEPGSEHQTPPRPSV